LSVAIQRREAANRGNTHAASVVYSGIENQGGRRLKAFWISLLVYRQYSKVDEPQAVDNEPVLGEGVHDQ
jgi:hypothetical protein